MFGLHAHATHETVAVVDIDSGSAAVAIVALEKGKPATILSYHRQGVAIAERSNEAIGSAIGTAVETAAGAAAGSTFPRPSAVYIFLHVPWARSSVVHAVKAYDTDIKVTEAVIADAGKEAIRSSGRDQRSFFETSVVRVELNGYPTAFPIGKTAHRVSASALASVAEQTLLRAVDETLARVFPDTPRIMRSGARALVAVSNALSGRLGDTVIIEIGQEATSLLVVRRGVLEAEGLLSEGTNGILRRIGGSPEETLSTLHLIGKDLCDSATCESMNVSLARIEPDLVRLFGEAFADVAQVRRLPNRLTLLAHPDMSHWLASFFARIDFSQFSVTSQPFDATAIQPTDIAHLAAADSKLEPDVSLLAAAACVRLEQYRAQYSVTGSNIHPHPLTPRTLRYTSRHMAKDYFQDIVPPQSAARSRKQVTPPPAPEPAVDDFTDEEDFGYEAPMPERSIRNIPVPQSRTRTRADAGMPPQRPAAPMPRTEGSARSRSWIWILAGLFVVFVGTLAIIATRGTVVTITPHSQLVTFDQTAQFTAYPAATAATGTLSYSIQTVELEDSAVVSAQGTQHVETKASGSITIYNDHSSSPVELLANTRFETPDGLIFRIPAKVSIPGKTAAGPGSLSVTVQADQPGDTYNIAPVSRFTVPGLKGGAMYDKVYASSQAAFTGGFVGEQPGVDQAALATALTDIRTRIEAKARETLLSASSSIIAFPGLASITYQELPSTPEGDGTVRVHQKAIVTYAAFPADIFATVIAQSVSADVTGSRIVIKPGEGYGAVPVTSGTSTPALSGTGPLPFAITGKALLVWEVDILALQKALAGRNQAAFQTIITGFPSIDEAHVRIEPFWKSTFPSDPTQIGVTVKEVTFK